MSGIRKLATVCLLAAVTAVSVAEPVEASSFSSYAYDRYHRSLGNDYPSVGYVSAFGFDEDFNLVFFEGSAVLITPRLALTAGHVAGFIAGGTVRFGNRRYDIRAMHFPMAYLTTGGITSNADLAIIRLTEAVRGVTPVATSTQVGIAKNKEVVSAGYGLFGDGVEGGVWPTLNVRRAFKNRVDVIDSFSNEYIYDFDAAVNNPDWLPSLDFLVEEDEWDDFNFPFLSDPEGPDEFFDPGNQRWESEDFPVFLEGVTTPGDSGGGVFLGNLLVGIHSWGGGWITEDDDEDNPTLGKFGGFGASSDIAQFRRWIERVKVNNFQGSFTTRPGNPLQIFDEDFEGPGVKLPTHLRGLMASTRGYLLLRSLTRFSPAPDLETLRAALKAADEAKANGLSEPEYGRAEPQARSLGRPGAAMHR